MFHPQSLPARLPVMSWGQVPPITPHLAYSAKLPSQNLSLFLSFDVFFFSYQSTWIPFLSVSSSPRVFVHNAAINMGMHTSFWWPVFTSFTYWPRSGIAPDRMLVLFLIFWGCSMLFFTTALQHQFTIAATGTSLAVGRLGLCLPMCRVQAWPLVGVLRSHMPRGQKTKA